MRKYDVAAYVWPSYHYEPRMEQFWPEKDGEWYTVRRGTPRFPGHEIPRIPLLGYQDEADPKVMREQVKMALDHGVNVFIMDWYWYENAPCFERQLNEALIPALEGTEAKFYIMWANHDADSLWDMHTDERRLLWTGQVSRDVLEPMFDRIIDRYLKLDSYYRIADKPVFSIFDYSNLVTGLGGLTETRDAFDWMYRRCVDSGLPGLHLQANVKRLTDGPEAGAKLDADTKRKAASVLKFDSVTSYQYRCDSDPDGDYVIWANKAISSWDYYAEAFKVYYPHASVGWDNTQRNPSMDTAVTNATPDAFEACLWKAKQYIDVHPDQAQLVTINSWNEWTEGSYLLPDMRWGYRYLQAIRNVFGNR